MDLMEVFHMKRLVVILLLLALILSGFALADASSGFDTPSRIAATYAGWCSLYGYPFKADPVFADVNDATSAMGYDMITIQYDASSFATLSVDFPLNVNISTDDLSVEDAFKLMALYSALEYTSFPNISHDQVLSIMSDSKGFYEKTMNVFRNAGSILTPGARIPYHIGRYATYYIWNPEYIESYLLVVAPTKK